MKAAYGAILAVSLTVILAGCTTSARQDESPSSVLQSSADAVTTVMVAGDSLAGSYFASSLDNGFVGQVVAGIDGRVDVTRAERAHQALAVVSGIAEVPDNVDIAIIELGTNDVGIPTPEAEFRDGYAALLDRVRVASPDAKLVCLGTWTGWGWTQDETIRSECVARDGAYVHLRDLFDREELHGPSGVETPTGTSDWFHPNDEGHSSIARRVLVAIDEL